MLRVALFEQLLKAVAVTVPLTTAEVYETVILAVPCPDMIVPPAGTVHCIPTALVGKDGIDVIAGCLGAHQRHIHMMAREGRGLDANALCQAVFA